MVMRRFAFLLLVLAALVGSSLAVAGGDRARVSTKSMPAFYDGHRDSVLALDTSNKALAKSMHMNFAPGLRLVSLKTPEIYFVDGRAARGQLHVLSSEPGEDNYTPIWRLVHVSFKKGQTPVLLTSDTQIDKLLDDGVLEERATPIKINCPVVRVNV
jgi:hypothetical protein